MDDLCQGRPRSSLPDNTRYREPKRTTSSRRNDITILFVPPLTLSCWNTSIRGTLLNNYGHKSHTLLSQPPILAIITAITKIPQQDKMTIPPPSPAIPTSTLKSHSPTLTKLLKARPAPIRETALLAAASSVTRPVKPPAGDCCGSSCDPCVMDLYAQELKVWKECVGLREQDVQDEEQSAEAGKLDGCKVPGAFEW